jgi:uncharacterized membrane protein
MTIKRKKRCLKRKIKMLETAIMSIHFKTNVYFNDSRSIAITNIAEKAVPRLKSKTI